MKSLFAALLATAALSAAAPSFAQGLLDNALDGKPAPAAKPDAPKPAPAEAPDVKPKPAADNPGGTDITNPDTVKKVDEDELLAQLMKPGAKPDQQAVAQRLHNMVDRMGEIATRLTQKDPGDVTQEVQHRIVADLDLMIELARQQQQSGKGSSQQQQPGQQRTQSQNQSSKHGEGGNTAAMNESLPQGGHDDAVTGDMRNHDPANWGGLPPRDRDQISHGANEEYLSSYKDMIDRYYQALAEIGKTKNH